MRFYDRVPRGSRRPFAVAKRCLKFENESLLYMVEVKALPNDVRQLLMSKKWKVGAGSSVTPQPHWSTCRRDTPLLYTDQYYSQEEAKFHTFRASLKKQGGQCIGATSNTGVCRGETIMLANPAPWGATIIEAVAKISSCFLTGSVPKNSTTS